MTNKLYHPSDEIRPAVIGAGDHAAFAVQHFKNEFGFCALLSDSTETSGALKTSTDLRCPALATDSPENGISFLHSLGVNLIILAGTKWIFKPEFIEIFKGNIINIHPSDLPRNRGAGIFSWQILNGIQNLTCSAYWLTKEIDIGPELFKVNDPFCKPLLYPTEFIEQHSKLFKEAIKKISFLAKSGKLIRPNSDESEIDEDSSYFPRLLTEINGAIDWNWSLDDLDCFIRAFGPPYSGAFSFYKNERIEIVAARPKPGAFMHPFCLGLIINNTKNNDTHIACNGGILSIESIKFRGSIVKPANFLKIGGRIWTPSSYLDTSRIFRPK